MASKQLTFSQCVHCGAVVYLTEESLHQAIRMRGGPCCKVCKYKRVSAGNKGKGRYHCASSGRGIPL